jgi:ABC-type nickel/cobalt efflux system permease component RcnA
VIAAYLAGQRGSTRDALVVGATVTVTHTGGVLVLSDSSDQALLRYEASE